VVKKYVHARDYVYSTVNFRAYESYANSMGYAYGIAFHAVRSALEVASTPRPWPT